MDLIRKMLFFFQQEGAVHTFRRILSRVLDLVRHFPPMAVETLLAKRYYDLIRKKATGKKVYILMPCFEWKIPLFQRPHQIALALSKQENAYVLFVSDEYHYDNFAGVLMIGQNLDVISRRIVRNIRGALGHAENVIAIKTWPMQSELLESIPYDKLIYEYIDSLSLLPYHTRETEHEHHRLMACADLTVCTARMLYDDALPYAKRAILSPNGGDYPFFHGNRNCSVDPGLAEKTRGYECVIGYYGSISDWFDTELIDRVAKEKPEWCFVLVGNSTDGTERKLRKSKAKNIILIPAQPYSQLPHFVSAFDIQMIPFRINEITAATSPVKLFEYMASGKPILTSKMPECMKYRSVTTYASASDFILKVPALMAATRDPAFLKTMDEEARNNTWEARVDEILQNIN